MNKKILIISNPGELGAENYCAGVNKDVENYKKFFTSSLGGKWYEWEIEHLIQPDVTRVENSLEKMRTLDYSIIVFTGHGYSMDGDTYVELKPGKDKKDRSNDLRVDEFRLANKKRLIIVDCCRSELQPIDESEEVYMENLMKAFSQQKTRERYERRIQDTPLMNIIMYSCDFGETSGDDSRNGGYYSSALLKVCNGFEKKYMYSENEEYLSAVDVHNLAIPLVKAKKEDQNPQIEKPRSEPYLPFAIV